MKRLLFGFSGTLPSYTQTWLSEFLLEVTASSCAYKAQTVYKDGRRINEAQNIPDTGAAILRFWLHVEPESEQ